MANEIESISLVQAEISALKKELKRANEHYLKDTTSERARKALEECQCKVVEKEQQLQKLKNDVKIAKLQDENEASREYQAMITKDILDKINAYDIVQIIEENSFFIKLDGNYRARTLEQLNKEIFRFESRRHQNQFLTLMEHEGRNYLKTTLTFDEHRDPKVFNIGANLREHWLKPRPCLNVEKYVMPWAIRILFTSLSGGDIAIQRHLEELIVRKYRQPMDYKLPSLFMFGQGGVGKNELYTEFLSKIFVEGIAVTDFNILTNNAHSLLGKVCVLVDETIHNKSDYEKVKGIIGNKTISIKQLYKDWFNVPNVWWLGIVGNNASGPVAITDDSTTRRFSVIKHTKDLFDWIDLDLGTKPDFYIDDVQRKDTLLGLWGKKMKEDFTQENIAAWLGYVMAKFPDDNPVSAYHGQAYTDMVEAHQTPLDELINTVIIPDYSNKPNCFTIEELYMVYKAIGQYHHPGRNILGKHKFISEIDMKNQTGKLGGWTFAKRQIWKMENSTKEGDSKMILPIGVSGRVVRNFNENLFLMIENGKVIGLNEWRVNNVNESTPTFRVNPMGIVKN